MAWSTIKKNKGFITLALLYIASYAGLARAVFMPIVMDSFRVEEACVQYTGGPHVVHLIDGRKVKATLRAGRLCYSLSHPVFLAGNP